MTTAKQIFCYNQKTNGSKPVIMVWSQDSSYLAVGTDNHYAYILDKRGKILAEKQFESRGKILMMDWDNENELLAVIFQGLSSVHLWSPLTTNTVEELQLDQKYKLSWLKWARSHSVLACGDEKGYMTFYNKKGKKKIPTMGKHSKKIIDGDWNNEGLLVTGSEDKIIMISNHTSENAANSIAVKSQPNNIKWMSMKTEERQKKQTTICCILNQKTLLIHDIGKEQSAPLELMFESKYGKIMDYQVYGDGYIVLGFTEGYYCHISTHEKEMKDEVKSERVFNAPLEAMAVNEPFYKLALAGEGKVKIVNLADWKEIKQETFELPAGSGKVASMRFSQDGSVLIIATQSGFLFGYILSINMLTSTCNDLVGLLASPTEVMILSCASKKKGQTINNVNIHSDPAALCLGHNHLAARYGNTIKYYRWLKEKTLLGGGEETAEVHYEFVIKRIEMNEVYVGILDDKNKVHLSTIQGSNSPGTAKQRIFPVETDRTIVQYFLTKVFLIFLDNTSRLKFYHIEDKNVIMEHKPDNPILRIFPNKNGTKLILQHQNGEINLFFTSTETYHHMKLATDRVDRVIWDNENPNEFVLINGLAAYSYIISKNNVFNHIVSPVVQILSLDKVQNEDGDVSTTKVDKNVLALSQGSIFFITGNNISCTPLTSHAFLNNYKGEEDSIEGHTRFFFCNISLRRFKNCLVAAKSLKMNQYYDILGRKALEHMDLEIAIKAYQMCKNLAMVLTIEPLLHQNQKDLLLGHIAMILGKYDLAQEHYLASSQPLNALDMRCDTQDWFIATSLTKNIAPEQESFISKRLASQTESLGNNTEALKQFQKSVINSELKTVSKGAVEKHNSECFAGIARTSIKLGDVQRGFNIAREIKDKVLLIDIAVVCENMKQFLEAAQVYDRAEQFEKAATLYLQLKMFKQAAPLMNKIKSPSLLVKYGKAKESEGAYKQAEEAYQKAESYEDVVRINLNYFQNWEKPRDILRNKCSTSTVASLVANYCEKRSIWNQAIQFLLMANRKEEAFALAQAHQGGMDIFSKEIKDCSTEDRVMIAQYWEGKGVWQKAAEQYDLAKNSYKALKLYIKAGETFIESMLKLVQRNASQQNLVQQLEDYLMGQADEQPKDPIYTYRLYRILGDIKKAAKIAVTIASQDQQSGNYKNAHDILFQSYQDIKKANVAIPLELQKKLSVLHSYIIAIKRIAKMEDHLDTALLLNKVSKNIIQFPAHAASILTTTVVKAMRADLKGLAYTWAIVVFRQEYKADIPEKYVERIKRVAMRPVNEETPEPKSPCPFCKEPVGDYQDDCSKCLNFLPFCIASGKHVIAEDLAQCKHCKFPMRYSYMKKSFDCPDIEKTCAMCNAEITMDDVLFLGENGVGLLKRAPVKDQK